jgi:hypothetical protein
MSEVGTDALTITIEGAQQKSRSVFHPAEFAPSALEVFTKKGEKCPSNGDNSPAFPFMSPG